MKRYMNWAFIYAILAMCAGVFYREFTKFNNFMGKTTLSVVHTHYFMLGMVFFLLLMILEKNFSFMNLKTKKILIAYNIGLNICAAMFVVRGVLQVLETPMRASLNGAISGLAGVGHVLLGTSLVLLLLQVKSAVAER